MNDFAPKRKEDKKERVVQTGKHMKESRKASKFKGWSDKGLKRM